MNELIIDRLTGKKSRFITILSMGVVHTIGDLKRHQVAKPCIAIQRARCLGFQKKGGGSGRTCTISKGCLVKHEHLAGSHLQAPLSGPGAGPPTSSFWGKIFLRQKKGYHIEKPASICSLFTL
jgi:hypothetical protein